MTDKELRRLTRQDLVELLYELQKENLRLQQELAEAKEALQSRELHLRKAGSIAEAALALNEVFERAQAAADDYLRNLYAAGEQMEQQRRELLAEAQRKAGIEPQPEEETVEPLQKEPDAEELFWEELFWEEPVEQPEESI